MMRRDKITSYSEWEMLKVELRQKQWGNRGRDKFGTYVGSGLLLN